MHLQARTFTLNSFLGMKFCASDCERLTCHLKKSLYGLKLSGRNWYKTLTDYLVQCGFVESKIDPCIFIKQDDTKAPVIILFWVDDIIIASDDINVISEIKLKLGERFKMDDRAELRWFLGIDFKRLDDGSYNMSQERYIDKC